MSKMEMKVDGTDAVVAKMTRRQQKAASNLMEATLDGAALLLAQIKQNASGRPGPQIQTGEYLSSWYIDTSKSGIFNGKTTVTVKTDAPQANRLEYGFVGVDSEGRHYAQPPYPHVRPAVAAQRQAIIELQVQAVKRTNSDS